MSKTDDDFYEVDELLDEYASNPFRARQKFLQVEGGIFVIGYIVDFDTSFNNTPILKLSQRPTGDKLKSIIRCEIDSLLNTKQRQQALLNSIQIGSLIGIQGDPDTYDSHWRELTMKYCDILSEKYLHILLQN